MKNLVKIIALLLILSFSLTSSGLCRQLSTSNNEFAIDLYKQLSSKKGNIFFSPLSISMAFAIVYAGSAGNTEKQIAKVMHFDAKGNNFHSEFSSLMKNLNAANKPYKLNIANRLWIEKTYKILGTFTSLVNKYYGAGLEKADFIGNAQTQRQIINKWVESRTNGKIKDLLPNGSITMQTRLVITNAIYFYGKWESEFRPESTNKGTFHVTPGQKSEAMMMNQTNRFKYFETNDLQGLIMPYVSGDIEMVILLPKKIDGIKALEKSITASKLNQWIESAKGERVNVTIPKLKMTSDFSLADTLQAMGMKDAFNGAADFSKITKLRDLMITGVFHKAYADVNEKGTEAAAATGIVMGKSAMEPGASKIFRADHPFMLMITETKTNNILFMGRASKP